jgi:hypothetical protein
MTPPATVIIPHRNEQPEHLRQTIESARAQMPGVEVLAIEDAPAIGVSFRRHEGIERARSNLIIISDAHCLFNPGLFAGARDMLEAHPRRILCFDCRDALPDSLAIMREGTHRSGAFLRMWKPDERTFLDVKWRYFRESGPVPCILGGVYALRRDWYMDGLGGIWKHSRGYGYCEQILTLATRKAGGESWCMAEHEHSHLFKPGRCAVKEPLSHHHIKQNAWLAIHALCTPEERAEIFAGKGIGNPAPTYGRLELDRRGAIADVERHFAGLALNPWQPPAKVEPEPAKVEAQPQPRRRQRR